MRDRKDLIDRLFRSIFEIDEGTRDICPWCRTINSFWTPAMRAYRDIPMSALAECRACAVLLRYTVDSFDVPLPRVTAFTIRGKTHV